MKEKWCSVPGWEDFYEVSNQGNVRSKARRVLMGTRFGYKLHRNFKGRILKQGTSQKGYKTICFTAPGRLRFCTYAHTLVALVFLGPRPEKHQICHWDGNPANNKIKNLRYGTPSENSLDRNRHGTVVRLCGQNAPSAKLNFKKLKWIFKNKNKMSMRAMGRKLKVSHHVISLVLNGKTYKQESKKLQVRKK